MRPIGLALVLYAVAPLAAAPAGASTFCGCNGDVALSFAPAPEIVAVLEQAPDDADLVSVEVHAVFVDVERLEGPRGAFLDLGGYELELRITGAEPLNVTKQHLIPFRDFGARPTQCLVGTVPGERLVDGPLAVVKWRVTFQGEVSDVRFDLDPAGLLSCERTEGCEGSGASVVYVGTVDAGQEGYIFAAGCRPAVLNPTGDAELDAIPCTRSHAEVGVYERR
jgi:hypothetical protein